MIEFEYQFDTLGILGKLLILKYLDVETAQEVIKTMCGGMVNENKYRNKDLHDLAFIHMMEYDGYTTIDELIGRISEVLAYEARRLVVEEDD